MKCPKCGNEYELYGPAFITDGLPCLLCGFVLTPGDIFMQRYTDPPKAGPKLAVQLDLHDMFKKAVARHLDLPKWP